jgi:hypothetical protein
MMRAKPQTKKRTFHVCFSIGVNGYATIEATSAREAKAIFGKAHWSDIVWSVEPMDAGIENVTTDDCYEKLTGSVIDLEKLDRQIEKAALKRKPRKAHHA